MVVVNLFCDVVPSSSSSETNRNLVLYDVSLHLLMEDLNNPLLDMAFLKNEYELAYNKRMTYRNLLNIMKVDSIFHLT